MGRTNMLQLLLDMLDRIVTEEFPFLVTKMWPYYDR